ncbi:MAG TPA: hypothetical protein VIM28_01425, partial [Solirubrobacterales bacterium]
MIGHSAVAASAGRFDPQDVARLEVIFPLARERFAVEQVPTGLAVTAAVTTPRGMATALADQ